MLGAIATLTFLLFPPATFAAVCGCAEDACPVHGGQPVSEARSQPSCHGGGAPPAAACNLVAPCPHSAGATPLLAHPPAVLSAAVDLQVAPPERIAAALSSLRPREIARAVSSPPPRPRAA